MGALHDAIAAGDDGQVTQLIRSGCNVREPHLETGELPLVMAARSGNIGIFKQLFAAEKTISSNETMLASLEKAVQAASYIPNAHLQYYMLATIYKCRGKIHSQLPDNEHLKRALENYQQAIKCLEYIPARTAYDYRQLLALHKECIRLFELIDEYMQGQVYCDQAIFYIKELAALSLDVEETKALKLKYVNIMRAKCRFYFQVGDRDLAEQTSQQVLTELSLFEPQQRKAEFFLQLCFLFSAWCDCYLRSRMEYLLFEFAELVFACDVEDSVFSSYPAIIGTLTSERESAAYAHLLTPMIQIMTLMLESYASVYFPNPEVRDYLSKDAERKKFQEKIEELKQIQFRVKPLEEMSMAVAVRQMHVSVSSLQGQVDQLERSAPVLYYPDSGAASPFLFTFPPEGLKRLLSEGERKSELEPPAKRHKA